jgi:hypothetical protein
VQTKINQVLENSGVDLKITESNEGDIAKFPDLLQEIIQEKYNTSLLWQICDVLPVNGTLGRVYVSKKVFNQNKFEIVKQDVNVETHKISSGFTQEVLEDTKRMFGLSAKTAIGSMLRGVSDYDENMHLMNFIEANATEKPELVLTADPRDDVLLITQKIGKFVMEMNQYSYKTKEAWAILPRKYIGVFTGYWAGFRMDDIEDERYLYIGKFGRIHLYIDPRDINETMGEFTNDFNDDYDIETVSDLDHIYVGLRNEKTPGEGSLVFSPYQYHLEYVTDPDTGETVIHLFNRYGLTNGIFHKPLEQNSILYKFKISRII